MNAEQWIELAKVLVPAALSFFAFLSGLLAWLSSRDNSAKLVINDQKTEVAANASIAAVETVKALGKEIVITKEHINSRMTELLAAVASEQRLKGSQEGIQQGLAIASAQQTAQKLSKAEGKAEGRAEGKGEKETHG